MKCQMPPSDVPKSSRIRFFCASLLISTLIGCRFSKAPETTAPLPLSHRVTWGGVAAMDYSDAPIPNQDGNQGGKQNALSAAESVGSPWREHRFLFANPDSLELRLIEYREAYWAYAAFQAAAGKAGIARGTFKEGQTLRFLHGVFYGELKALNGAEIEPAALFDKLLFQGEDRSVSPKEFAAFPLLGRVPYSERVISSHFLGRQWRGPVFTVGYKCHDDTATAFRAFPQDFQAAKLWLRDWSGKADTLDWGREIRFQGLDEFRRPLIFWIFSEGIMGFAGCFDPLLSQEYAEKMEKSAILWPKP
jgi:hypothetical protein